jgi:DNA-damage-inducible protein J
VKGADIMANSTMVNFRMDSDVKASLEKTCKNMGLTLSSAFNMFATKVIQEQRIPFEITADPFYSKENMETLKRRIDDINNGVNVHEHELIEVEDE